LIVSRLHDPDGCCGSRITLEIDHGLIAEMHVQGERFETVNQHNAAFQAQSAQSLFNSEMTLADSIDMPKRRILEFKASS